jgi:chromosome segregation ATPase
MTFLVARYETQLKEKFAEIDDLKKQIETMRSRYELRINELDLVIKRYTQTTLQLDARILELENEVKRLQDVEDQLRMAREYIGSLEAQKDEL